MGPDLQETSLTLEQIATLTQSKLIGDPCYMIKNFADLKSATSQDISFLSNPRYLKTMIESKAGAFFIDPKTQPIPGRNFLIHEHPAGAFQQLLELFYDKDKEISGFEGIHPTAVIHDSAAIEEGVALGPYVVIDKHAQIGKGTTIGAGSYIGPFTRLGAQCIIHPRVTVRENCTIGNRVILQPGCVIGSCGFGYKADKDGNHQKLKHIGKVVIEDDVEIGANTTIDRAQFQETRIREGTKIDNLVQIAHNVVTGKRNLLISQCGIAGSTELGDDNIIAAQTGVLGHLKFGNKVVVAAKSGVSKSLQSGVYGGIPAVPIDQYNRTTVMLRNIKSYVDRIQKLEKMVIAVNR